MKKVLLILILFLSCYVIYNKTIDKKEYFLTIGDSLSKGINEYGSFTYGYNEYIRDYLQKTGKLKGYNKTYTNIDYRIMDIVKILEYNETIDTNSLNYLIKKADIITISLGMNELYYKLNDNNKNMYNYIDNMLESYKKVFEYINLFHQKKIYILGYYNITNKNTDIFEYANYKLKKICKDYKLIYIDLSQIFNNNPIYFNKKESFIPNTAGYKKISQIIIEKYKNN